MKAAMQPGTKSRMLARRLCVSQPGRSYADGMSSATIEGVLHRSDELDASVWGALPDPYSAAISSPRHDSSLTATLMAIEHARAFRLLVAKGMTTTAIGVARMQFEALCRAMWLLYAATDDEVKVATAALTLEAEKGAKSLPMAAKMVDALDGKAPPGMHAMMSSYKEAMLKGLHSFVHAGLHPLHRHVRGYPETLLLQVAVNCNGVLVMTGAFLSILAGSQSSMHRMNGLQRTFSDCLPELLAPNTQGASNRAKASDPGE